MAKYHAKQAGVDRQIHFRQQAFHELSSQRKYGCIITNPPYGERLEDLRSVQPLYETFPGILQKLDTWSLFVITNVPSVEKIFQRRATRRRKLFNGRIECMYYQYLGPRPPRGYFEDDYVEPEREAEVPQPTGAVEPATPAAPVTPANAPATSATAPTRELEQSKAAAGCRSSIGCRSNISQSVSKRPSRERQTGSEA